MQRTARLLRSIADRIDPRVSTVVIRQQTYLGHGTPRTTSRAVSHAARQSLDTRKQDDPIALYVDAVRGLTAAARAQRIAATDVHPWPRFHLFNLSRRTLTAAALTLFPLLALVTCSHPAG